MEHVSVYQIHSLLLGYIYLRVFSQLGKHVYYKPFKTIFISVLYLVFEKTSYILFLLSSSMAFVKSKVAASSAARNAPRARLLESGLNLING